MNACLIMGHKNPCQIIRLAKRLLDDEENYVIIHLDSLMVEEDADIVKSFCSDNNNVHLCSKRIHGILDKRNLVDIVFIMISAAKEIETGTSSNFSYYLLFSGQDYPIKRIKDISNELAKNYPKPYIDCTPYDRNNWIYHKFVFCKSSLRYHEWITTTFNKGIVRSGLRVTEIIWTKLLDVLGFSSYHKLAKEGVSLYGGSAWWILPDVIIDFIMKEYVNNEKISELILNESTTPEETFFQIMTMRSPLSYMVIVNPKDMVLQNCKTWAYFFDEGKPFKGHPYVFTINELGKLEKSEYWFARKFDADIDCEVMDALDYIMQQDV